MLGDAIKLPCVAAKPALVAEGVGYILDSDVSRIRNQWPEADAGEGCYRAIGTHTPENHAKYTGRNSPSVRHSAQEPARWVLKDEKEAFSGGSWVYNTAAHN